MSELSSDGTIPVDKDGFVASFSPEDASGILEFFREYGFVVVRDVLDQAAIDKSVDEIWKTSYLLGRPTIKRDDPSTWENGRWPTQMGLGESEQSTAAVL